MRSSPARWTSKALCWCARLRLPSSCDAERAARLLAGVGLLLALSGGCGGKVDAPEGAGGSGGSTGNVTTFSCTVHEVEFGYSWCALASADGSCNGEKGRTCAEDFRARCTYRGLVIHYYDVDEQQIADVRVKCQALGATFTVP